MVLEDRSRPAIVDVVFAARSSGHRRRLLSAVLIAVAAHGSLWFWAARSPRRFRSSWSGPAARVHDAWAREADVDLAPAPPPDRRPRGVEPRPRQPVPTRVPAAAARSRAESSRPAAAQAGAIIAREPDPGAPLDLTGETFVTGTANAYRGGVTASTGTSPVAVQTPAAAPGSGTGAQRAGPDRSRAVSLEEQSWSCPWPPEGDADQVDEQTVVIRVVVGAAGIAESAEVLSDPGHGFGPAAVACALRTRFTPARDRRGEPVRARSPPIRVRFTR